MSSQLDARIRRMMEHVVAEAPPPPDITGLRPLSPVARPRFPKWAAAIASAAVVLVAIGGAALLVDLGDGDTGIAAASTTVPPATTAPAVSEAGDGQTVSVTVAGVSGHQGDDFAAVLYEGDELTDLDDDALGGFWWVVPGNDEATTTEVVRESAAIGFGRFPFVFDEALIVEPGTYTLVLWVDDALNPASRQVPINTDGMGLFGCHVVIEVADAAQTDVAVTANLEPDGWNINCTTGQAIPGTNSTDAVAPSEDWPFAEPDWPTAMPAVSGVGNGQTVSVAVSGVSGHTGDELAGVLYQGAEPTDLDDDALGGFWWVVGGDDDATTTEVVRRPAALGDGRFPYVTADALTVEPGTYTLVLWVDDGLGPVSRWVPVNSDGMGLYGCHFVFEVSDAAQTHVAVTANLEPDGWNINCTTGQAIPGTNSADAVAPSDGDWWPEPEWPTDMSPVSGVGDGQTIEVAVSGVSGHTGDEFAGVLYEGGELTNLDADALGGFWWVVSGNDAATTTEVVRQPAAPGNGRFPYVSDQALTVEPGTYTLVLWVDDGLGPARRWVPVNTDGRGLFGCHVVFEVTDETQTDVAVTANLEPDGWNINCTTGQAIPGTNSADAVAP